MSLPKTEPNEYQQLELQGKEAQIASLHAETAKAQAAIQEMQAERRGIAEKLALTKARTDCGVRFLSNAADTETLLRSVYDVVTDDAGNVTTIDKMTGKAVAMTEAFQHLALDNPSLADGRSLRHLKGETEADGTPVIRSKADFEDDAAKRDFINKKGLDAFERLPLRPVDTSPPKTFEEFSRLPVSVKTKLISQHGEGYMKSLPREADLASRLGRGGIRANKTGK